MEQATLGALLAAVVVTRFAASADASPYVQYPLIGASALLGLFAIYRLWRSVIRPMAGEIERLQIAARRSRRELVIEQWRRMKLDEYLRSQGLAIPDDVTMAMPPVDWLRMMTGDPDVEELA